VRQYFVFLLLLSIKLFARLFYRIDMRWIDAARLPPDPWRHIRVVAVLNHTSLFEPLFAGAAPNHFLWRIARHGVVPIAQKTSGRAVVGRFYGLIAQRVIPITRERDESWEKLLAEIDPDAMVGLLPEGRMMRPGGLDSEGKRMTVRGGIADILESIGEGRLLLGYSGGLHHVQAPGERWPRLFKTIRIRLELLDIGAYRRELMEKAGPESFKRAVIEDLERRRDLYCPVEPGTS
jgi:1-acyl-sn-glycerol-3-phosphate acyltransferase